MVKPFYDDKNKMKQANQQVKQYIPLWNSYFNNVRMWRFHGEMMGYLFFLGGGLFKIRPLGRYSEKYNRCYNFKTVSV